MSIACSFVSFDVQSHEYFGQSDGYAQVSSTCDANYHGLAPHPSTARKGWSYPPPPPSQSFYGVF